MSQPQITVVMSAYNAASTVASAITSILRQSFKDFEFIIVNDGSTDSTGDILHHHAQADSRIRIIEQQNTGLTVALDRAIRQASGKRIVRQDADDVSEPNRLEVLATLPHRFIVSAWRNLNDGALIEPFTSTIITMLPKPLVAILLRAGNFLCHGTYAFDRDLYLEVGGYRSTFVRSQDYDLAWRLLDKTLASQQFQIVEEPLYRLRMSTTSISHLSQTEQWLYALLALLAATEVRKGRADPTTEVTPQNLQSICASLIRKNPLTAFFFCAVSFVRSRNPVLLKLFKSSLLK